MNSDARSPGAPRRPGHENKPRGSRLRGVCFCVAAALAGGVAQAATVVSIWTSATSGIWNSDSNWTSAPAQGGFPNNGNGGVATYDAVVNATGAAFGVNLARNTTADNLLLNSRSATIKHTGIFTAMGATDVSAGTYSLSGGTTSNTAINLNIGSIKAASRISPALVASKDLTWTGTGGAAWDVNTTTNWNDTVSGAEKFLNGDRVTFGDGPTQVAVTVASGVSPGKTTVNSAANNYTFTSTADGIAGPGNLENPAQAR